MLTAHDLKAARLGVHVEEGNPGGGLPGRPCIGGVVEWDRGEVTLGRLQRARVLLDLSFAEFEELPELDVILDDEVA